MSTEISKLTDFKPIERLTLPDLGELTCAGLIVVVGPNSSGKSQLLRDIQERISGEPRDLVVADTLELAPIEHESFLKCLKAEGYIYSFWDDNDQEQYMPKTTYIGTTRGAPNVDNQQLEQWKSQFSRPTRRKVRNEYVGWFSRYLVTGLFLEKRLTSMSATGLIDFKSQPPTHDLHALHLNDDARDKLLEETQRAFSKSVWPDVTQGHQISLRVGEEGQSVSAEDRLSATEMSKYRTLESEGDGMKSYVATVVSLLLGRRPVSVIDEPEMCLHPPQAYNLGQFIGESSTSKQTATFIATHSSHILRGVLQAAGELQIVRMTRTRKGFSAKHIDFQLLAEAMKKPTVRAETVLDGIFSQAVTIIEADGDRIVYQAAWEAVSKNRNFDIHFTAVGGTGGFRDTCQLYKMLGIPVAIIADLDLITDTEKTKLILQILCDDNKHVDRLLVEVSEIADAILKLPPTISESVLRNELRKIANQDYEWAKGDDRGVRAELGKLNGKLNGMRSLKRGGITALPSHVAIPLNTLLEKLCDVGLFLVPVGELEYWLSSAHIDASKEKKWAWANEAAEYLRTNTCQEEDIWKFMNRIGEYLTTQFE